MTACGYTPAEIDDLAFCDVEDLFSYWKEFPPIHEILRVVYQVEHQAEAPVRIASEDPSGIGGLIVRFPDGFVRDL